MIMLDRKAVEIAHEKRKSDWEACRGAEEASTLQIIEWYEAAKQSNEHPDHFEDTLDMVSSQNPDDSPQARRIKRKLEKLRRDKTP